MIAIKSASGVKLISRNEKDLSGDYPELVDTIRELALREQDVAEIAVRVDVVRAEANSRAVGRLRLFEPALLGQRDAEVVVGGGGGGDL